MNFTRIANLLGGVNAFLCVFLLPPLVLGLADGEGWRPFATAIGVGLSVSGLLWLLTRGARGDFGRREGFIIVTMVWVSVSLVGALPYFFSGEFSSFTNALFESISGYTTTGATILQRVSHLPRSILLWRATTQWLGGMGMVLLSLAVMPLLGFGGVLLFKAEAPGPSIEKLKPRIQSTALLLWWVYVILTTAAALSLRLAGMNTFDAICHSLTVMASGGFSTHDAGIMGFESSLIEWILIVFMLLSAINFVLHYRVLRGEWRAYAYNEECRGFLGLYALISLLVLALIARAGFGEGQSFMALLRQTLFQTASVISTTGYHSADSEAWRLAAPAVGLALLILMSVGGMGGSTAGGIKAARLLVVMKLIRNSLYQLVHPRALKRLKVNDETLPDDRLRTLIAFLLLYIFVFLIASVIMAAIGLDDMSALSSVAACMSTTGPGFGTVNVMSNYASVPAVGKWVLMTTMLIGRLELYTILILFTPAFWRR